MEPCRNRTGVTEVTEPKVVTGGAVATDTMRAGMQTEVATVELEATPAHREARVETGARGDPATRAETGVTVRASREELAAMVEVQAMKEAIQPGMAARGAVPLV